MKEKTLRSNFKKFFIIVIVVVGLLSVLAEVSARQARQSTFEIPELLPVPTTNPTPMVASEKALRIASNAVVRMTEGQLKEFKTKYGDENMENGDFIAKWALMMDADPVVMAQNKAIVEKIKAEESKPVYNSYETYQSPSVDTSEIENQLHQQKNEMESLKRARSWDCMDAGGVMVGDQCM